MTIKSDSVTIREVAQKAGVSIATVSRYINRNAPISKDVAERILKEAWEGIDGLLPESHAKRVLQALSDFLVSRSK